MQRSTSCIRASVVLKGSQQGFSLIDILLAMAFGSAIMLAAMQLYPTLRRQSQNTLHVFRLDHLLQQTTFAIEKDLRRAGFCTETCEGHAVTLGQLPGEPANSCVIIAYDFMRRGNASFVKETFGYRLRAGAIETSVGAGSCTGGGWERLLEPQVARVTQFSLFARRQASGVTLYELHMAVHWPKRPEITRRIVRWVAGRNA